MPAIGTDPEYEFHQEPPIDTPATYPGGGAPVVPSPQAPPSLPSPLDSLVGTWKGQGFNAIWRPHNPPNPQDRFLELNPTDETLVFTAINGPIPNRGLLQTDIAMFGATYLQQISDSSTGSGLHIEPGIWAVVPETTDPLLPPTVVRMASIPHGTTILAQGTVDVIPEAPTIPDNDIIPFGLNGAPPVKSTFANAEQIFTELNLAVPTAFREAPIPPVTQAMVENPNSVLQTDPNLASVTTTTILTIATDDTPVPGGGTSNTAFLAGTAPNAAQSNANASLVTATFWIETIQKPDGHISLQLQYSQTVMLDFNGLRWPHVTVATLIKQ